ncbi:hypothetical protein [Microbacterium sp. BK668]|uniref:hypothetical protein n=1 Tax=Microbacterium sp. BK668 TaxID=2512118 RepID=UPI001060532D|nr:hypothetical protein [Microbacterium sp. BK668]TDN92090.1 hypothetical protein EV279_1601 [Microbacterium sp. BK668]
MQRQIAASDALCGQAARRRHQDTHPANRAKLARSAIAFVSPVAYLLGGILPVLDLPGVTWFAVGSIAAIVAAVLISRIALVEVLR